MALISLASADGTLLAAVPSEIYPSGALPKSPSGQAAGAQVLGETAEPLEVSFVVWGNHILTDSRLCRMPEDREEVRCFGPDGKDWPQAGPLLASAAAA